MIFTSNPTTHLSDDSIAKLAEDAVTMDIGALTRISECTVQANGETWTVPAYWSDDEIVAYIATTITQRKTKVQPPNAIVHNQLTGRVTDSATLRQETEDRKVKHKPKPQTSHGIATR